jgi:hypothetical protein
MLRLEQLVSALCRQLPVVADLRRRAEEHRGVRAGELRAVDHPGLFDILPGRVLLGPALVPEPWGRFLRGVIRRVCLVRSRRIPLRGGWCGGRSAQCEPLDPYGRRVSLSASRPPPVSRVPSTCTDAACRPRRWSRRRGSASIERESGRSVVRPQPIIHGDPFPQGSSGFADPGHRDRDFSRPAEPAVGSSVCCGGSTRRFHVGRARATSRRPVNSIAPERSVSRHSISPRCHRAKASGSCTRTTRSSSPPGCLSQISASPCYLKEAAEPRDMAVHLIPAVRGG